MKQLIRLSNRLRSSMDRKTAIYSAVSAVVVVGIFIALLTRPVDAATSRDDTNTQLVMARLNNLQTEFELLQDTVKKPMPDVDFSAITQQINQVSARLEAFRASSANELSETLSHTETTLSNKLDSITDVVTHLDAREAPVKFIALDALPFKVVSIDSIQQIPVASIAYDFKTVPLEQGDALAGWRVVSLDYTAQRIELVNQAQEHVLVTNEHMG